MSEGLTDQVSDLSKRMSALEGADIQDKLSITRLVKIYGTVRVTVKVIVSVKPALFCSDSLYCDDGIFF